MDNNKVTYIPYGLDEISQQELMTNLANGIPEYLSSKRWALKPKNLKAWMAAYLDIIGKGLAGASNSSGVWKVNTNNTIDLDSMSDKDREIYQDAAYYIQQQMARMTPRKKKEEEKKKDLKTFNFSESFKLLLLNNYYGGDEKLFLDPEEGWNSLDAMDEKAGVRGTTERKKRVLSELLKYLENFKDDDYTFEGTSFTDASDARTKIQAAIDALNSSDTTADDAPAFNALGLLFRGLFSNGANEVSKYTLNGLPLTWKEYADYLKTEEQNKIKAELDKVKAQRANQYDNYKYYNFLNGTPSNAQDFEGIVSKLSNQLALDGNDISRISWAFMQAEKSGGLVNLSKEELAMMPRYASNPSRLKKIQGLDGIYYDTYGKKLIRPYKNNLVLEGVTLLGILDLNSPEAKSLKELEQLLLYLNNTDFTDADWAELSGMALDIASIVDPEPWSAGVMGLVAAGARNYARTRGPLNWGFWDYASQAGDYLTGVAGAIPILGDSALAYKTTKNIVPWLRRAMRVPAFLDLWNSTPELMPIGKKLFNGESLTVQDWMNLGTFIKGLATTRTLNVQNRAARKALLERGYKVDNKWHQKAGLTLSKPIGESVLPTLKINIKGTNEEIPITPKLKLKLDSELSKAGNDIAKRNKILRENPEVQKAVELHMKTKDSSFKIKEETTAADGTKSTKISDDWNNASAVYNESLRNARLFKLRIGLTPRWARTSGGTFGEKANPLSRGNDNFNLYLSSDRGLWEKFKYGSDKTLKGMDKFNLAIHGVLPVLDLQGLKYSGKLDDKTLRTIENTINVPDAKAKKASRMITPKNSTSSGKLIDGSDFLVLFGKNKSTNKDEMFLIIDGKSIQVKGNTLGEMKQNLGKMILELNIKILSNIKSVINTNDLKWKDFVKSIKDLKRKGYLYKQGGQINPSLDTVIEDFFKNNNI